MEKLTNIIESLLFVSGKEVSINDIAEKLEISVNEVRLAVLDLQKKYKGDCGLLLLSFNDKIQFGSNPDYGEEVSAVLNPIRERELSRSLLETAAIIAYKQPVTRLELEELRGNSDYAVQRLLKMGIIEIVGRKDTIGHPSLLGTTDKFLKRFRISSLDELPDYDELMAQVKMLNSVADDNYLYRKDVYVDDGSDDNAPPLNQFVPKTAEAEVATTEDEDMDEIKDEEIPDFLEDEDVELIEADEDEEDEFEDEEDEDFEEYSIDDEDTEFEDEEEDTSEYDEEDSSDEDYEEDD